MFKYFIFTLFIILFVCTGCRSGPEPTGTESLELGRIELAKIEARNELRNELRVEIDSGLAAIEQHIRETGSGLQQLEVALREYRKFVQAITNRLSSIEIVGTEGESGEGSGTEKEP